MNNKVLIKVYVPMLGETFDIFIPVNEYIWKINKLVIKSVGDISSNILPTDKKYIFINAETGMVYDNNNIVINSDIRNASKLVLIEV